VWDQPDQGLWETRTKPAHHVHSKVLAWAALDRAAADAQQLGLDERAGVRLSRWRQVRHEVRADVLTRGFNEGANTFVREYGSRALDGALLRLPLVGYGAFIGHQALVVSLRRTNARDATPNRPLQD
jgi:GH15 family glucan-1,4-alpha-glucosidase